MRKYQPYLESGVIYQINLRSFTNDGTLNAASELLPHLKSLGIDIVYLCPCFVADSVMEGWSPRQIKSETGNPANPYRIADYYNVDPEYGTNDDLKAFVAAAHELGLRVILDLVYYHCGPTSVFLKDHPDFIKYKEDGTPDAGEWNFPKLNYENPELREYLIQNMEMYVRDYGVDGYRCDVGDAVPLDFWAQARERIEALNPDLMMLNEGAKAEYIDVFDLNYCWALRGAFTSAIEKGEGAKGLSDTLERVRVNNLQGSYQSILYLENHDTSNDDYSNRLEKRIGSKAMDACFAVNLTLPNVPFIYCGTEIADTHRHSIWGNRFHAGNLTIDWQKLLTEEGQRRLALVRKLCAIRKQLPELGLSGSLEFVTCENEKLLAYVREKDGERVAILVNLSDERITETVSVECSELEPWLMTSATVAVKDGKLSASLGAWGFAVVKVR